MVTTPTTTIRRASTFIASSGEEGEHFFSGTIHPSFVSIEARWQRQESVWRASFELPAALAPEVRAIVPSFAARSAQPFGYVVVLEGGSSAGVSSCVLTPIGENPAGVAERRGETQGLTADIDTFVLDTPFDRLTLTFFVSGIELPRSSWVLSISCTRNASREVAIHEAAAGGVSLRVPPISQMRVPEVGTRICSPTSVAMLLRFYGVNADPRSVADAAYCAAHDLYGVWPWSIYAASRRGVLGLLACFEDWEQARMLLDREMPIVASIRYGRGELTGAALEREEEKPAGHLLVIRGYEGSRVLVNDPAAPDEEGVLRSYDLGEFLRVWLSRSALGYILLPPSCTFPTK